MHQHFGTGCGGLPQLFSDVGHDRVQQNKALIQHPFQRLACLGGFWRVVLQQGFGQLYIPVANLAPDKGIKRIGRVIEAIVIQCGVDLFADAGGFADDPFVQRVVDLGVAGVVHRLDVIFKHAVHLGETVGVPQFGAKVAVAGDACGRQFQIASHGGHCRQGKAHRIRAVFVDQVQRVQHVAERFGHLLALLVAHKCVDIDGVERLLIDHGVLHHHHSGDPEKDNVETGDQHRGGEVFRQLVRLLGPAERADRPKTGREPRVEHIGVAGQGFTRCHCSRFGFGRGAVFLALVVEPNRNLVPPPQLARDAPGFDVLKPMEIHLFVLFGQDLDITIAHGVDGRLHNFRGLDEPLIGQHRLDNDF